jgi:hypothetical protein
MKTIRLRGRACALAAFAASLALAGPATAAPKAPVPTAPAPGARSEVIPAFSWAPVAYADHYDFQIAADSGFNSMQATASTKNTFATLGKALPDGTYYWRVRAVNGQSVAGNWSKGRSLVKAWLTAPVLSGPAAAAAVQYPDTPLVFSWSAVPHAFKYLVSVGTDPTLAGVTPVETSGTNLAWTTALAPGAYYWAVQPEDAEKYKGTRSAVRSFTWTWDSSTQGVVNDLADDARVFDPQLSWNPIKGAAHYEVEVSTSSGFAVGSKVCCDSTTIATSISPTQILPNNDYYWRVRAVDANGDVGDWNIGPSFSKSFDNVPGQPSIQNLRLVDMTERNQSWFGTPHDSDPITVGYQTGEPLVRWDPVAGASSYELQVAPWTGSVCDWNNLWGDFNTVSTAWAPWADATPAGSPGGLNIPPGISHENNAFTDGQDYCVQVKARTDRDRDGHDVFSVYTILRPDNSVPWSFQYKSYVWPAGSLRDTTADDYNALSPDNQHLLSGDNYAARNPVFSWSPIPGAVSYFVLVARDANFTNVVDAALVWNNVYAPRMRTFTDETSNYYWKVVASPNLNGAAAQDPRYSAEQAWQKQSVAPLPLAPTGTVTGQPVFHWTSPKDAAGLPEEERSYELQVSSDPGFGHILDDVRTDSEAYTAASTYPPDTALYWRVRVGDENNIGLNWSATGSFRRTLPVPVLSSSNPTGGDGIPVVSWSPVQGATSYDLHVDQADGTTKDFSVASAAFSPTSFWGTGVFSWQVRSVFPKDWGNTPSAYSPEQSFTRTISEPTNAAVTNKTARVLFSWDSKDMAKQYRIQVSTSNDFTQVFDDQTIDGTSYAPTLTQGPYIDGGRLFWRVAVIDEGGNAGDWSVHTMLVPKRLQVGLSGSLTHGTKGTVTVTLLDAHNHPLRGLHVKVGGCGLRGVTTHPSNRKGVIVIHLRPMRKGTLTFTVTAKGFKAAFGTLSVG